MRSRRARGSYAHIRAAALALEGVGATVEPIGGRGGLAVVTQAGFAAAGVASMGLGGTGSLDNLVETANSLRQRNWLRFRKLFRQYDLLLCPTIHSVAPTIDVFATRIPSGMSIVEDGPGPMAIPSTPGFSTC